MKLPETALLQILLGLAALAAISPAGAEELTQTPVGMISIAGGSYKPLYSKEAKPREVAPFFIDETLITNRDFLSFVTDYPEWRRARIAPNLADKNYLSHWKGELDPGEEAVLDAPVTNVSWFAAKAYCEAQGKRLPSQDEWELVALADATRPDASKDQAFLRQLLEWYSKPSVAVIAPAAGANQNVHGIRGLHGLVWEWVQDFNSTMVVGDSRGDGSLERKLFCGADALLASDVGNYAAFMRYAFRSSLKGNYCVGSLGFRAGKSPGETPEATAPGTFTTIYELPGTWRTQKGEAIALDRLRGKVRVISMGFTRCEYACPRIFSDMQRIETTLGRLADKVEFSFFSIDPDHDTPESMTLKMEELKLNPLHWTLLTSPEATVQQLAVALDFKFQKVEEFFAHSNLIAVLDSEGKIVHREESLGADIAPAVEAIRKIVTP